MPEIITAPAPAAAAPITSAPAVTPPVAQPTSKELAGKLFGLLTASTSDEPKPPEKKVEEPAPAAPKPPVAEKPIKRKEKETPAPTQENRPAVPKREDLTKAPAGGAPTPTSAAAPAPKAEVSDADFEKELIDEERAQLEDARSAEKYLGDKFKGYGTKMAAFLKENAKKAAAVENGDLEQSDYQKWHAANLPKIGVLDQRRITEERVRESVRKDYEPKIDEERHARWADSEKPKITARGNEVYNKLSNSALPDDVVAAIAERTKGITDRTEYLKKVQEVQKDYALEFEVAEQVFTQAANDIEEFHRLTTKNPATGKLITEIHPDSEIWDESERKWIPNLQATNPVARHHAGILAMVNQVCEDFKSNGGTALKNADGKWFATREEWHGMAPQQRGPFWTFTNEQLIDRALSNVKGIVSEGVKARIGHMEGRGFKRTIAAPAQVVPPPAPSGSGAPPAPRIAPPPGAGGAPTPSIAATLASRLTSQPSTT